MTPFQLSLKTLIETHGPLPLSTVMGLSNDHYYIHQRVFGAAGDFITSPEISQIFGEILAIWVILQAKKLGTDAPHIVELGPGRGTLMADMIRIFKQQKHLKPTLHLVETSQSLKTLQQQNLANAPYPTHWHNDFPAIEGPAIIIANEFFDALPMQQYIHKNGQWQEVCVDYQDGQFVYTHRPATRDDLPITATEGAIMEHSDVSDAYAKRLAHHLKTQGGAALIIDYGDDTAASHRFSDTFQALYRHKPVDPLTHLGEADLTYHVDFARIKESMGGGQIRTQGEFLKSYGFDMRLSKILEFCKNNVQKEDQLTRAHRLVDPKQMGDLFKVLEVEPINSD